MMVIDEHVRLLFSKTFYKNLFMDSSGILPRFGPTEDAGGPGVGFEQVAFR